MLETSIFFPAAKKACASILNGFSPFNSVIATFGEKANAASPIEERFLGSFVISTLSEAPQKA